VTIKNPFLEIDLPIVPEDTSEEDKAQSLRPYAELKIFKAIEDQCKNSLQRIKWITLVNIALITCLRRGVLLKLKWGDIDLESRIIKVRKSCWGK
jgi:integrase